jgi:6,7-dimethyl-8-ribityllumazine synthase
MTVRLAILVAEFNRSIIDVMVASAEDEAKHAGAQIVATARVPGSYELPFVLARALAREDVDAAVVLGYIERGETLHGEVMGQVVHRAFVELSLQHRKPVGVGIIGPGATLEQAQARRDPYARAAVRAALAAKSAHDQL